MKIRVKRKKKNGAWCSDIGTVSIPLNRKTLRIAGPAFKKALKNFGIKFCKDQDLSLVEFHSIEVTRIQDSRDA